MDENTTLKRHISPIYTTDKTEKLNPKILQAIIDKIYYKLFDYIGLDPIKITISNEDSIYGGGFYNNELKIEINTYQHKQSKYAEYDNIIDIQFKNFYERFLFTLCHELGHYIQYRKFNKWTEKRKINLNSIDIQFMTIQEYNNTPLEKNANKIGKILFKKCKEWYLTNSCNVV